MKFPLGYINKWVILGATVVVIIGGISVIRNNTTTGQEELMVVNPGLIQEGVAVSGKVKSAALVDLAFEKSGKITRIYKKVGEYVEQKLLINANNTSELVLNLAPGDYKVFSPMQGHEKAGMIATLHVA